MTLYRDTVLGVVPDTEATPQHVPDVSVWFWVGWALGPVAFWILALVMYLGREGNLTGLLVMALAVPSYTLGAAFVAIATWQILVDPLRRVWTRPYAPELAALLWYYLAVWFAFTDSAILRGLFWVAVVLPIVAGLRRIVISAGAARRVGRSEP